MAGIDVRRYVNCCDLIARIPPQQFDQGNVSQLLTELAHPEGLGTLRALFVRWAIHGAATAIATTFHGLRLTPLFRHVTPACYADRDGARRPGITDEARLQDQEAARRAYQQPATRAGHRQLKKRFKALGTMRKAKEHGDALQVLRSFAGHLFAKTESSVPFRDLADHAPINYVSLFTGRS